jgi:hypothetical protein
MASDASEFDGSPPERLPTSEAGHDPDDPEWFTVRGEVRAVFA